MLGLEGEEEPQEYEWEEAGTPGTDNSTQKPELCLTPSGTVGGTVGGSGSRIAGPEAKAGRQPSETAQEPTSYFPEQVETPDTRFLPFLLSLLNACLLLGQSTRSDPVFISQAPPRSVTSHRPSLPSPAHHSLSQFHSCQYSSDPGGPHLRGCSSLLIHPRFGTLCPSPCCLCCRTELSPAVLG